VIGSWRTRIGGAVLAPGAVGRRGGGLLALAGLLVVVGLLRPPPALWAKHEPILHDPPQYALDVTLDPTVGVITGTMTVRLAPGDPRRGEAMWFHLPPNRFLERDSRGPRRDEGFEPFGFSFVREEVGDPIWPAGFDAGRIEIHEITSGSGQPLAFAFEDNPGIPAGFSTRHGLMLVSLPPEAMDGQITIHFTTHLPRRYWEGWTAAGVFAEQWHPQLLVWEHGGWLRDVFRPRPALYDLRMRSAAAGWFAAGGGGARALEPGEAYFVSRGALPLRSLPIAWFQAEPVPARQAYGVDVQSFHPRGQSRLGELSQLAAIDTVAFMRERFQLDYPFPTLTLIPVDSPLPQMRTVGSLVLIPRNFYRNSALLDRVLVARLSAAVAQVWFGEALWADADREAWLSGGLSGLVSLEFFATLYGPDAGTHNLGDWLRPRFREHYFEMPVRRLKRDGEDAPVMVSQAGYPLARSARIAVHEKATLLLRMLAYVVGDAHFSEAINRFFIRYRFREADLADFQQALEAVSGRSLHRFFSQFFYSSDRIDVALETWEMRETPEGYLVDVTVARLDEGVVPVTVEVRDEEGRRYLQRWDGELPRDTVRFLVQAPVAGIVLDPNEYLLELDRQNNYSNEIYRVRPFFDWPKQRESLVALRGWAGGNAVDGNFVGMGVQFSWDEDNSMLVVPGVAERHGNLLYDLKWNRSHFLHPRLALGVQRRKVGGTEFQGLGFTYRHLTPESMRLSSSIDFRLEWVQGDLLAAVDDDTATAEDAFVTGNNVNNISISHHASFARDTLHPTSFGINLARSDRRLESDFDFTSLTVSLAQELALGGNHVFVAELVRGLTDGIAPQEKQFLLGDPGLLRGYPRVNELINEQVAVFRLDYQYVFSRAVWGNLMQTRRWSLILFGDVGKGWDNGVNPDHVPQRQDMGLGMIIDVNALGQVTFPVRMEVAFPVNDPEYTRQQYVLFGALAFF